MIKKLIRNIVLREKASPQKFAEYLKKKGVKLGENVHFYSPSNTLVDMTFPWLISIGDDVNIAHGVIILTHDFSWSVLKGMPDTAGAVLGAQLPVNIGNNVFIGMNAIITRGVTIGDNVIIGTGSVVTKDCEANSVYAGVPAKRIMSTDEYFLKRKEAQFPEAKVLALKYKETFGENPPKEVFCEYFMLFCSAEEAAAVPEFRARMEECRNFEDSFAYMQNNKPMFSSYEAFLAECYSDCGKV